MSNRLGFSGSRLLRERLLRRVSLLITFNLLLTTVAPCFQGIHSNAVSQKIYAPIISFPTPYTDTAGTADVGAYPFVDPVGRGGAYDSDGVDAINTANSIEAGVMSIIIHPPLVSYAPIVPPDDSGLDLRINPNFPGTQTPVNRGWVPIGTSSGSSATSGTGSDDPNGPAVAAPGATAPRAGTGYAWEASRPGGGSSAAPGYVNTQTGNRTTVVPLFSNHVRGGMNLGLTLYHNSQDNLDIGWGMNWRSNYDYRAIYVPGQSATTNSYVVTYPSGTRITFKQVANFDPLMPLYLPPRGIYDRLSVDSFGNAMLNTKDGTTFTFSASNGYLNSCRDRAGNTLTFNHVNPGGNLSSVVGPNGESITFSSAYAAPLTPGSIRHYTSVTAPRGQVYSFSMLPQSYQSFTVLRKVSYPAVAGKINLPTETFYYNQGAAITTEIDKNGASYGFSYDGTNRLTAFSYPIPYGVTLSGTTIYLGYTYTYNASSTVLTDPFGATSIDNYSGGLLISTVDKGGYATNLGYDNNNNVNLIKNARGYTTYLSYDNYGNCTSTRDPQQVIAGVSTQYTYNLYNDLLTVKDSRGAVTTINHDPTNGAVLSVTDALGNTQVTNTYNSDGTLATTSSQGVTTNVTYNIYGQVDTITRPGQSYQFTYGPLDKPSTVTDIQGRVTHLNYDESDRVNGITRADNATSLVTRDFMGNVLSTTDWLGHITSFTYDTIGRLVSKVNARGDTETYSYRGLSMVQSITDGKGQLRTYTYTPREEVATLKLSDGSGEAYQYDANGNQVAHQNGLAQTTRYTYSNQDLLTGINYPDGTSVSFGYDNDGRRTSMLDASGSTNWAYDNADRLITLTQPQGLINYSYDQWGRRTKIDQGGGNTITYNYTADQLTSLVKAPENETTTWSYDSYNRLASQTYASGAVVSYGYDVLDRVNSIVHQKSNGTTLTNEAYTYDAGGNLSNKTVDGVTTTYGYDAIDQITSEVKPGYSCSYTYDGNGNRLSKTLNGLTDTYTYGQADKLLSRTGPNGTYTYTVDWAGRTTQVANGSNVTSLAYDCEDRVTSLNANGYTSNYTYNGLSARVAKSAPSTGYQTYKRDGTSVTSPVLNDGTASMVPGISERRNGATKFLHPDYLGSTKQITDATQAVTDTMSYDAFGMVQSRTGTTSTQSGFAAAWRYQEDSDSGLKLVGHRYYDAATGRFLTRDPIGAGKNWYAYCSNNPLKQVDPTGLDVRDLTPKERDYVVKMITWLWDHDQRDKAVQLQQLLRRGRIKVQTGKDQYDFWGKKVDAFTFGDLVRLSEDTLYGQDFFYNMSTFVHEMVHVDQNQYGWLSVAAIHSPAIIFEEKAAYRAEKQFALRMLRRKDLSKSERECFEQLLQIAKDNLGE